MPFQGMDFGTGIGNLGQVLAEGYRAKQALEQQNRAFSLAAANTQYDNLLKNTQITAEYGDPSGSRTYSIDDVPLGNGDQLLQSLRQGAGEGLKNKPKATFVAPTNRPLQTIESGGQDDEASAPQPTDRSPAGDPDQEYSMNGQPAGQQPSAALPPQAMVVPPVAPMTKEELAQHAMLDAKRQKILSVGGTIDANGVVRIPNYVAQQWMKSNNADIAARTQALIRGYQGAVRPDTYRGSTGGNGGGAAKVPDKFKQIEAQAKTFVNRQAQIAKSYGIDVQLDGVDKLPPAAKKEYMDLDQKIRDLSDLGQAMVTGTKAAPQQTDPWQAYLQAHPTTLDTPANRAKFQQHLGQ